MSAGLDGVLAILHVGSGGRSAMAISRVGAGSAGMRAVKTKAMCPTIKHLDAIISDDMWHHLVLWAWRRRGGRSWTDGAGSIGAVRGEFITDVHLSNTYYSTGAVVAKLRRCELAEAFFVFRGKVQMEFNQRLVSHGSDAPGVARSCEDAGRFKQE